MAWFPNTSTSEIRIRFSVPRQPLYIISECALRYHHYNSVARSRIEPKSIKMKTFESSFLMPTTQSRIHVNFCLCPHQTQDIYSSFYAVLSLSINQLFFSLAVSFTLTSAQIWSRTASVWNFRLQNKIRLLNCNYVKLLRV